MKLKYVSVMIRIQCLILFLLMFYYSRSQDVLTIAIVAEEKVTVDSSLDFQSLIKEEINALMTSRKPVRFYEVFVGYDQANILNALEQAYQSDADIVITIGLSTSAAMSSLKSYPKPSIAGIVLNPELQQINVSGEGNSDENNFTFVVSPFDLERDLDLFHKIYPYQKLGIVADKNLEKSFPLIGSFFDKLTPYCPCELIGITGDLTTDLKVVDPTLDALYVLPTTNIENAILSSFFNKMTSRGIPTFSLFGRATLNLGVMASVAPDNFAPAYARRIALDVLKIFEGQNPSTLPVYIDGLQEDFVLNMAVVKALGIYPDFDIMNQATWINIENTVSDKILTLKTTILEAMNRNLDYKISNLDWSLASQDVKTAKSNLLPNLDVSLSTGINDQNNFITGTDDEIRAGVHQYGLSLSQLVFSEPVLASITIQKLVESQQEQTARQQVLDVILNSSQAYLNYLQAKSLVRIQNENVSVTKQNLDISKTKNKLGYSGLSDVYRLESQIAQNAIDLNDALASLQSAGCNINLLLNRPQMDVFEVSDVSLADDMFMTSDPRLNDLIKNQRDLNRFTNFIIDEAKMRLPEIEQIELGISAQERLLKSNRRSYFLPQLSISGKYDKTLDYYNLPQGTQLTKSPTWSAALGASLPIFSQGRRGIDIETNKLTIEQLKLTKQNAIQSFEFQIRAGMETLGASYTELELSQISAEAALKNFDIVQDLYRQGQSDIVTLLDAQNAALQGDLVASNALYTFMIDFLTIERYSGQFYFLMNNSQKEDYIQRLMTYLIAK